MLVVAAVVVVAVVTGVILVIGIRTVLEYQQILGRCSRLEKVHFLLQRADNRHNVYFYAFGMTFMTRNVFFIFQLGY